MPTKVTFFSPIKIFTNMYITNIRKPTNLKYIGDKQYFRLRNLRTVKDNDLRKVVRFEKCLKEIKPNKDAFKGHIYILTSSITLSSSTMFCKYLKGVVFRYDAILPVISASPPLLYLKSIIRFFIFFVLSSFINE